MVSSNLTSQSSVDGRGQIAPIVVLGEVLWDILPDGSCLGGAPLNFAVHAARLGYQPVLISAVGADPLGRRAVRILKRLDLLTSMVQTTRKWPTGKATVELDPHGQPTFTIHRPAAYDALQITDCDLEALSRLKPAWIYYGTLFPSTPEGKATLFRLLAVLPGATQFYDINLRPGFEEPALVSELLARADVVKLNESEATTVARMSGLPEKLEEFCRAGTERFGWRAVCVTLGACGCAILNGGEFVRADGYPVPVADSVGTGDAFAAAFLHGLTEGWPAARVAAFANRVGAIVASRVGATPEWTIAETAAL